MSSVVQTSAALDPSGSRLAGFVPLQHDPHPFHVGQLAQLAQHVELDPLETRHRVIEHAGVEQDVHAV